MIGRKEYVFWFTAVFYAILAAWPASYWYDAGELWVSDYRANESLPLEYSGGARRDFIGSYSVIVREFATGQVVAEDRSSPFRYKKESARPDPLTIEWWAPRDDRINSLPSGQYVLETCWTVHRPFWIAPSKTTCVKSNPFRVLP